MKSKYIWYWTKQPWPAIEVDLSVRKTIAKSSLNSLSTRQTTTHERGKSAPKRFGKSAQSFTFLSFIGWSSVDIGDQHYVVDPLNPLKSSDYALLRLNLVYGTPNKFRWLNNSHWWECGRGKNCDRRQSKAESDHLVVVVIRRTNGPDTKTVSH